MLSTASASRPRFMSVLLLALTFLSFFGLPSAAPLGHAHGPAPLSLSKRMDANDPFSQTNVIRVIRETVGRMGFIFYQSPYGPQANALADANSRPPPGYWSFDMIYSRTLLARIGNPDKGQTNDAMKMSVYMAEAARGNVGIVGGEPPNPNSFWMKYEYPILRENMKRGKITAIRYYAPGEENVENYYAFEYYDERSQKIQRRSNPNYRQPATCRRQGACYTSDALEKTVEAMNALPEMNQDPDKGLPTDIPDIQEAINDDDDPAPTDPTKQLKVNPVPKDAPEAPKPTTEQPTDPATPTEPTEPADPNTPTEPTDPNKPTNPNDPNEPTDPNKPKPKPTKPAPVKPPKA